MSNIEMIETNKLIPYDNNPRVNDDAVEATANSINEFGFQQPIVVDKNMVIIVGHTRLLAAKLLGLDEVPVLVARELSDEQVKAYRLADNKTGELSEWDFDKLKIEIEDIGEVDIPGFTKEEIDEILSDEADVGNKDISDSVSEKNQIILNFDSESEMEKAYTKLEAEGYDCQISTL